jgi:hypothetical protein
MPLLLCHWSFSQSTKDDIRGASAQFGLSLKHLLSGMAQHDPTRKLFRRESITVCLRDPASAS